MKHPNTHPTIVYIITKMELGGAQKVCLSLFHDLKKKDCTTLLITGSEGVLINKITPEQGAILLPTLTRELRLSAIMQEFKNFFILTKNLRALKKQYPKIIAHTHSTKAGIIGRWAAFFAGIGTRVHTIHGYGFHAHQNWLAWLPIYVSELLTSLITTHFVCVSQTDQATGARLFPHFAQKTTIIRAAIEHDSFTPAHKTTISQDTFVFGTIACFKPQKNLFDLLEAFRRVHQSCPQTRLEIIGDGALRKQIETWIDQHALHHAITLHGWQQQVAPIMATWNSFVLSSLWEGLPCAVIEARFMKLPVIAYATGGIPEVIYHERNGLICAQKDVAALANNMARIAYDQHLYATLSNYHDNFDAFTISTMLNQHATLYQKLLS